MSVRDGDVREATVPHRSGHCPERKIPRFQDMLREHDEKTAAAMEPAR